jgi:HD-GYP domain-containing protein (c-di-GMP phosphodiesterase class II)
LDRVVEMVRQSTSFLKGESSLNRIGALISHDYQTYSHSLHVFVYSTVILQTYDLSEKDLIDVGIGAVLHDLGKKTIPHEIIFKAGALTPEERSIVNSHPVKGVAMCSHLPLSKMVTDCILFHHEKMDGTGYPTGLVADDIPLPVRALAVCDVYDALTTNRPYSEARTPFESLRLMHNSMQSQLDRDVLKRLILILSGASLV